MGKKKEGKIRGSLRRVALEEKGGPGSGHHGHRGRQGTRGGSLPTSAGLHPGGRGVPDFRDIEKRAFVSEKTAMVDGQIVYAIVSLRRMVVFRDKPYRLETSIGRRGGKFTSTAQEQAAHQLLAELTDEVTTRLTLEGWKKNARGYYVAPWGPQTLKRIRLTTRQAPDRTLYELLTHLDNDGILFVPRNRAGFNYLQRQRNASNDRYWLKKIRRLRDDYYDRNFEAVPEDEPYPYEGQSYDEWILEQQVDALSAPPELPPAEELPPEEAEEPIPESPEGEPPAAPGEALPLPKSEPISEGEAVGEAPEAEEDEESLAKRIFGVLRRFISRGGPGSGHHGHRGRPGEVGGSLPAGAGAPGVSISEEPGVYARQPELAPEQIGPSVLKKMNRILNPITSIEIGEDVPYDDWKIVASEVDNREWAEGESFAGSVAADALNRWQEGEPILGEPEEEPIDYVVDDDALQEYLTNLNYEKAVHFIEDEWNTIEAAERSLIDKELRTYEDIQNFLGLTDEEFIRWGEADIKNAIELEIQRQVVGTLISEGQLPVEAVEAFDDLTEFLPGGRGYIRSATAAEITQEDVIRAFSNEVNDRRFSLVEEVIEPATEDDLDDEEMEQFRDYLEPDRPIIGYEAVGYEPSNRFIELLAYDGNEPVCAAQLRRMEIDLDDVPEETIARIEAETGLSRENFTRDFFALKLIQSKRSGEGYGTEMVMEILRMAAEENRGIVGNATMSAAMFYAKLGAVGYSEVFQTEGGTAFWTAEQVQEAYGWLQSEAARLAAGGEMPEVYEQEIGAIKIPATPTARPRMLLGPAEIRETAGGYTYLEMPAGRANVSIPTDMPMMYEAPEGGASAIYARQDDSPELEGVSYWISGEGWEGRRFADAESAGNALNEAGYTPVPQTSVDENENWVTAYIGEQWELQGPVTLGELVSPTAPPPAPAVPGPEGYRRADLVEQIPVVGGAPRHETPYTMQGGVRIAIGEAEATMVVPDVALTWYRAFGDEVKIIPRGNGRGGMDYELIASDERFYADLEGNYFGSIEEAISTLENAGYTEMGNMRPGWSSQARERWVDAYEQIWAGPAEPSEAEFEAAISALEAQPTPVTEEAPPTREWSEYISEMRPLEGREAEGLARGIIITQFDAQTGEGETLSRVTLSGGPGASTWTIPNEAIHWTPGPDAQWDAPINIFVLPGGVEGAVEIRLSSTGREGSPQEFHDFLLGQGRMSSYFPTMRKALDFLTEIGHEPHQDWVPTENNAVRDEWLTALERSGRERSTVEASIYGSMRRVAIERSPGGPGSGHHAHKGRPGEVGGSLPKGAAGAPAAKPAKIGYVMTKGGLGWYGTRYEVIDIIEDESGRHYLTSEQTYRETEGGEYERVPLVIDEASAEWFIPMEPEEELEGEAGIGKPGTYISVPASQIPPGIKDFELNGMGISQRSGAPIRGIVIGWDDERIPETVYHMTTALNEVMESDELSAAGVGGLGGDAKDQIVSMTIDQDIATDLAHDTRLAAMVSAEFIESEPDVEYIGDGERISRDPVSREEVDHYEWSRSVLDRLGELDELGGDYRFDFDREMYEHSRYAVSDLMSQYFFGRESATGVENPLFFTPPEVLAQIDPENVGIVAIPKDNLNNGALITDFDLHKGYGLKEIRSYGDVQLEGADFHGWAWYLAQRKARAHGEERSLVEKSPGGPGSGHHGHRGRPGEVGGSQKGKGLGKVAVGITSAKPGKSAQRVYAEMGVFESRMTEIKGVKNLSVQAGIGGWEGGSEPTWVVSYSGNGNALRLIAETARKHDQEAVLLMRECEPPQDCSPVTDFHFENPLSDQERVEVEGLLVSMGLGGWTWFRDGEERRVLRSVAVPQWGGSRQKHLSATRRLRKMFDAVELPHEYTEGEVWVDVMEREGDYAFETILTP